MKKRFLISSVAAIAAVTAVASVYYGGMGSARVDYFDNTGKILRSTYPQAGAIPFSLAPVDDDWKVFTPWIMSDTPDIATMRFVRWGQESYPVSIENDNSPGQPEIKVSYEVMSDGETEANAAPARTSGTEVKSGSVIRMRIEMPEGFYPMLEWHLEMSGYDLEDLPEWNYTRSFLLADFPTNSTFHTRGSAYSRYRNDIDNLYSGFGMFDPVEGQPGVWTVDFIMPNEPVAFRVIAEKPSSEILESVCTAAMRSLYAQYTDVSANAPVANGEPYIMQAVGDAFSGDYIGGLYMAAGYSWEYLGMTDKTFQATPWEICFSAVTAANFVISRLDMFAGHLSDDEIEVARARMLTLRSHAYWRLLQIYGARWQDSNEGEAYCAPLETTYSTEYQPLAKMKDILAQCYVDLDQAIAVFSRVRPSSSDMLMPGLDVARAVKMRLAMLREDWTTARDLAAAIMDGKSLSSPEDLKSGFFSPSCSWLWSATNGYKTAPGGYYYSLYYWSAHANSACNGVYPAAWGYCPAAIDKDLYLSIPESDMRRSLFAMPDQVSRLSGTPTWTTWYDDTGSIDILTLTFSKPELFARFYANLKPEGVADHAFTNTSGISYNNYIPVRFGAQVKFYSSEPNYSNTDAVVFLRLEEVLLSRAEASFRLGEEAVARQLLSDLNTSRNPSYTCSASGDALLKEIQLYRRIELWGEGHSWFDQKRWNLPIVRRPAQTGDPDSGNWPVSMGRTVSPSELNGWRYPIPAYIVRENSLIDISRMNYQGVEYPAAVSKPASVAPERLPAVDKTLAPALSLSVVAD